MRVPIKQKDSSKKKCKKTSFGYQRKFVANLHFEKQIKQKEGEGKV
jgi:hypothetical protein